MPAWTIKIVHAKMIAHGMIMTWAKWLMSGDPLLGATPLERGTKPSKSHIIDACAAGEDERSPWNCHIFVCTLTHVAQVRVAIIDGLSSVVRT
jgi:hypothetical protein